MFIEAVPEQTRRNLAVLARAGITRPFYLAGGTAAALHLGHRISVDLDFFGPGAFDAEGLAGHLADVGRFRLESFAPDTLLGSFEEVRISFFRYRYSLADEPVTVLDTLVVGLGDLAAMKIEAIGQRGARRDFVDLYFICQSRMTLAEALEWHRRKFADLNISVMHLIRSLAYFEDAEADPMPEMLKPVSWPDVRRFFEQEARVLFRQL
jgi:hypothetical protein